MDEVSHNPELRKDLDGGSWRLRQRDDAILQSASYHIAKELLVQQEPAVAAADELEIGTCGFKMFRRTEKRVHGQDGAVDTQFCNSASTMVDAPFQTPTSMITWGLVLATISRTAR